MPLTRAILDPILVSLVGETLVLVNRDGTTVDGTNPDVSIGIGMALLGLGLPVADLRAVADAEILAVADSDQRRLVKVAQAEILENILSNWALPNSTAGTDNKQDYGGLRNAIEISAARLWRQIEENFGLGAGPLPMISTPSNPYSVAWDRLSGDDGWYS